ncbi:MAG TPA: acyl-CoA dehydrogenase family protein [Albitalea sp.]|jgi:alkylation response protein AidB-like acyl-CoA dehydrogenase|nr:acyl-CoA dehydrogenase family protein [Albitalea sp.]
MTAPAQVAGGAPPSELDDPHRMLRDAVRDFASRETSIARVRRLRGSAPGHDAATWRQLADMGWTGILVPEAHGGLGLGLGEMAVVLEEFAKTLSPEPLSAVAVLAAGVLVQGDNQALKDELLPLAALGRLIPALAWQEDMGGIDPLNIATRVDGGALHGEKRFVVPADADGYLVSARDADGPVVYWIERDAAGLEVSIEPRADGTRAGRLRLDGVKVGGAQRVASAAVAASALQRAVDAATVMAGAELVGVMERALEITLEYMRTRVQFGKPIGSYQALQHRAVDLFIEKSLASAVLADALQHLDDDPHALATWASRVKSRCSDAGLRIGRESIQIHGGIGYADECDIGLYLKRAMVLSAWLGNGATHRRRYAALVPAQAVA